MKKAIVSFFLILVPLTSFAITQRVTLDTNGNQLTSWSDATNITPNGRYVLFYTDANNVVPSDTNYIQDVFIRDVVLGTTEIVSVDSDENISDGQSQPLAITPDGRYVLFFSNATNLVLGDSNSDRDLFVRDRQLGTTEAINVDSNEIFGDGSSQYGTITPDGRYVYFTSYSTNLVPGDVNGNYDAFLRDRQLGTTTLVGTDSVGNLANNATASSFISDNGRYVVFSSYADNIISGDVNNDLDIFYKDLVTNIVSLVSSSSTGLQGNAFSSESMMTPDGRYVLFRSSADNLVPGDTNGQFEPFVKDMQTNELYRVAVNNIGDEAVDYSQPVSITPDGRYVVFYTNANNLHPIDYNRTTDAFVRDIFSGTTTLVSIEPNGYSANNNSYPMMISDDGRYVYFYSDASNIVIDDNNWNADVFVRNMLSGTTTLVSRDNQGNYGNGYSWINPFPTAISMTPDGKYVVFGSDGNNLVSDDTNYQYDVFINEWEVVLGAAPSIVEPVNGSYRNSTGDIGVEGMGISGSDIRVTFMGNEFTTVVDANNEWSVVLPWQLDGVYTVYAQQKGIGEGVWSVTGSSTFTIDTVKPGVPVIVTPIENTMISGGSMYVVGQGEPGGSVVVKVGKQVKEGNIDGIGNWNVGPYTIVPGYKYGIVAKQRDVANNESEWTLPRTVYGVQMGETSIEESEYLPDLILYKKGVTSSNSEATVNPNEDVKYTLDYVNAGKGYSTGVIIVEDIPENTCFTVGSISGLNSDYIVEYSNTEGQNYTYEPIGGIGVQDCAVTHFRVRMVVPYEAKNNVVNDQLLGQINGLFLSNEGLIVSSVPNLVVLTGTPGESIQSTFGDFNNDGYSDSVLISYRRPGYNVTDYVVWGTGSINPSYEALEDSSSYPESETHVVATGDFNADGYDDVILVNGEVYFNSDADDWIYYGSSTGLIKSILTGSAGNGDRVAIGDFNADGYDDALLLNGSYWGDRGNSKIAYGGSTGVTLQTVNNLRGYIISSLVEDFNVDGYDDVLVGRVAGQDEIIMYGSSTGVSLSILTGSAGNTWGISRVDINQDGYQDILFINESVPVKAMYGSSTGTYSMLIDTSINQFYREPIGGSIDFNTDGMPDYVILGSTIDIVISQSGVDYGSITPVSLLDPNGQPILDTYWAWTSIDVNGDSMNDTVFVNRANEATSLPIIIFYNGSITGTYLPYNTFTFGINSTDFNNDGLGDILINSAAGFGNNNTSILYGVNGVSGSYQTILESTGAISGWDRIMVQEEVISGENKIEYTVYGVTGGVCNTGEVLVGPVGSEDNEIDIGSISGSNSSICVRAEFSIMSGNASPVLRSMLGVWDNEEMDSFTFDVKVKGGHYSGTVVTNTAYIAGTSVESNTGNNRDIHVLSGLPNFIAGGGGYGGGLEEGVKSGGSNGGGEKKEDKKIEKVESPQEKAEKINEIDLKKPEKPVVEIPKKGEDVKSVEIVATTPNIAIKEAIVKTSYVEVGSMVEVKTVENPVLGKEKRCYSPKEVVEITLGKEKTNKDLLVYQALLKSYDLTIFSDTDSYKPENGLKRYEAAKMFTNFAKHVLCREKRNEYKGQYEDIEGIDETLKPYIEEAYEYGILRGSNGKFRPLERISRKEFVAALMRMFTNENMDVYNVGNEWDREYVKLFEYYGLDSIVGEEEEIDRYEMSKILYKLYYNTEYEWSESGYVLPSKK